MYNLLLTILLVLSVVIVIAILGKSSLVLCCLRYKPYTSINMILIQATSINAFYVKIWYEWNIRNTEPPLVITERVSINSNTVINILSIE